MKKLFLSSVARNTLDKFVKLFKCEPKKLKVAFVPTAGNVFKDNWFVREDREKLVELGFNVIDINLENKTRKQLLREMNGVDIILVAGGNTFYLLQECRKSGFDKIITSFVKNGGMYIGSSAGTLLVCPSIEFATDIDDQSQAPELKSYDGLALVDFVVLPHYDEEYFKGRIDRNLEKFKNYKYKIIKILDNQAVLINGEKSKNCKRIVFIKEHCN